MESIKIRIKKITLKDFRAFHETEIDFDENITVLIGENGSGKSTIIDAISEVLKKLINDAILNEEYFKNSINFYDIRNDAYFGSISSQFEIIYPKDLITFYPKELEEKKQQLSDIIQENEDVIKKHNIHLFENCKDFDFENDNAITEFNEIIEQFQDEEIDLDSKVIESIYEIKTWLEDNYENDRQANFTIELHFNKESEKIEYYIAENKDEYERFKYTISKKYEEWIDSFPLFLDFGSAFINIDSKQFLIENQFFKKKHAIYKDAFNDKRYSINEFIVWFDNLYKIKLQNEDIEELAEHKIEIISTAVCKALNYEKTNDEIFSDLKMKYSKNFTDLQIKKSDLYVAVKQLSSGEKALLALVGDIARRAIMANTIDIDLNKAQGIVLIDEIDLHLHPKWQRGILPILKEIFPNIQFIVTTHSPYVVQNIYTEKGIIIDLDRNIDRNITPMNALKLKTLTENFFKIKRDLPSIEVDKKEIIESFYNEFNNLINKAEIKEKEVGDFESKFKEAINIIKDLGPEFKIDIQNKLFMLKYKSYVQDKKA